MWNFSFQSSLFYSFITTTFQLSTLPISTNSYLYQAHCELSDLQNNFQDKSTLNNNSNFPNHIYIMIAMSHNEQIVEE